jgi:hypothetical protein
MYRCIFSGQGTMPSDDVRRVLPNKRMKLPGADRSKGIGVLCPWRGTDFVRHPCAGGRVARSLSAIR